MSYEINTLTADCYEGTTCLINKFGIANEKQLEKIEADYLMISTIQAAHGITDNLIKIFSRYIYKI